MIAPDRKSRAPGLLPRWHPPKIDNFGIQVPPRKNTWPTFFKTISEHFAAHQTFLVTYPKMEIIKTSSFKNRVGSRKRMGEFRVRERVAKSTRRLIRVRFRSVPLPVWVTNKIEAGLKVKRDPTITDREWERLINLAIAEIVISSFKNN
jgi:hypothetical protein